MGNTRRQQDLIFPGPGSKVEVIGPRRGASATMRDIMERYQQTWVRLTPEQEEEYGITGLAAELLKYHAERRLIHEMLTAAGIPELSNGEGERICLLGRVGVAAERARRG